MYLHGRISVRNFLSREPDLAHAAHRYNASISEIQLDPGHIETHPCERLSLDATLLEQED